MNSQSHGPGQDDQTNTTTLLVAKNGQANHRLCPKLPRMPEKQGSLTPTLRTVLALGAPIRPVAVYCDGLHHATTTLGRI